MLRNESFQARKSLSGTPPFRIRLLFVCLFVYDQLKLIIFWPVNIILKKDDPQMWATIKEIGEIKFEKKEGLERTWTCPQILWIRKTFAGVLRKKKKRINTLFEVWSLINYISMEILWKKIGIANIFQFVSQS